MNKAYWNTLLHGNPRVWFYGTIVLFITTAVLLWVKWDAGQIIAFPTMVFAVVGCLERTEPVDPYEDPFETKTCRRPWFAGMALLLAIPLISMSIERRPDGSAKGEVAQMWDAMFGERPPLNIHKERRSESFGLVDVDFLIITNKSQNRIVTSSVTLQDTTRIVTIPIPQAIEPNGTVEARVQGKKGRILIETGDVLTVKCEGYAKPLIVTWQ